MVDICCTESVSTLFDTDVQFDFVINCAAETKLGQSDAVSFIDDTFYTQHNTHCIIHLPGKPRARFTKYLEICPKIVVRSIASLF